MCDIQNPRSQLIDATFASRDWGFRLTFSSKWSVFRPRTRNFCHFSGIRFTPGPFDRWRSSAGSNRLAAIKKPLLGARIRPIAHKRLIGNNGKRLECGLNKARHGIQRFASFRTLPHSAHRFVPCMYSKTAIIGLIDTQFVGEKRWERCLQNAKSAHRNRAPFGVCLLKRQPWPRSRATTAMFAATEHMAMQKYSRTKSKRAWQKQLKQEGAPRGSFLFTFYFHSGHRKQRAHEPERGHTAPETAAVSKGRHPICPEHEEGMQNATCACGRKRPARRANANWRIVSPPSRPNFAVRPPI